jgi:hypothetical protein
MVRQIAPLFFSMDIPAALAYYNENVSGRGRIRRSMQSWRGTKGDSLPLRRADPRESEQIWDDLLDAYLFVEDGDGRRLAFSARVYNGASG